VKHSLCPTSTSSSVLHQCSQATNRCNVSMAPRMLLSAMGRRCKAIAKCNEGSGTGRAAAWCGMPGNLGSKPRSFRFQISSDILSLTVLNACLIFAGKFMHVSMFFCNAKLIKSQLFLNKLILDILLILVHFMYGSQRTPGLVANTSHHCIAR